MTIRKDTDSLGGHVYAADWDDLFEGYELMAPTPGGRHPLQEAANTLFITAGWVPQADGGQRLWVVAYGRMTPAARAIFEDRMCDGTIGSAQLCTTRPTTGHPARYRVVVTDQVQIARVLVDLTTEPPAELQQLLPLPTTE